MTESARFPSGGSESGTWLPCFTKPRGSRYCILFCHIEWWTLVLLQEAHTTSLPEKIMEDLPISTLMKDYDSTMPSADPPLQSRIRQPLDCYQTVHSGTSLLHFIMLCCSAHKFHLHIMLVLHLGMKYC